MNRSICVRGVFYFFTHTVTVCKSVEIPSTTDPNSIKYIFYGGIEVGKVAGHCYDLKTNTPVLMVIVKESSTSTNRRTEVLDRLLDAGFELIRIDVDDVGSSRHRHFDSPEIDKMVDTVMAILKAHDQKIDEVTYHHGKGK